MQPGVGGQPAAGQLLDLVDLVERRARGGRVAGAAEPRRDAVVLAVGAAEVQVSRRRAEADRAAVVVDADEAAVQRAGGRARRVVVDAGGVREVVGRGEAGVQPRHRPAELHRSARLRGRADLGVGERIHAPCRLLRDVVVLVLEREHLAAVRFDQHFPELGLGRALELEGPHEAMAVAGADRAREPLAVLELRGREGDDLERRLLDQRVLRLPPVGDAESGVERLLGGEGRRDVVEAHVAPGLGADHHQVAVADRGHELAVAHGGPAVGLRDPHVPQVGVGGARAHLAELGDVHAENGGVRLHEVQHQRGHYVGLDRAHRPPQAARYVAERHRVAIAAAGDHRPRADDVHRGAGARIDEHGHALPRALLEERFPGGPVGQALEALRKRQVRRADVEVGTEKFLLRERRQRFLGNHRLARGGGQRQQAQDAGDAPEGGIDVEHRGLLRLGDGGWGRRKVHTPRGGVNGLRPASSKALTVARGGSTVTNPQSR